MFLSYGRIHCSPPKHSLHSQMSQHIETEINLMLVQQSNNQNQLLFMKKKFDQARYSGKGEKAARSRGPVHYVHGPKGAADKRWVLLKLKLKLEHHKILLILILLLIRFLSENFPERRAQLKYMLNSKPSIPYLTKA